MFIKPIARRTSDYKSQNPLSTTPIAFTSRGCAACLIPDTFEKTAAEAVNAPIKSLSAEIRAKADEILKIAKERGILTVEKTESLETEILSDEKGNKLVDTVSCYGRKVLESVYNPEDGKIIRFRWFGNDAKSLFKETILSEGKILSETQNSPEIKDIQDLDERISKSLATMNYERTNEIHSFFD